MVISLLPANFHVTIANLCIEVCIFGILWDRIIWILCCKNAHIHTLLSYTKNVLFYMVVS